MRSIRARSWFAAVLLLQSAVPAFAADKAVNVSLFTPVSLAKAEDAVTAFRLNLVYGRNTSVKYVDVGLVNHTTAGPSGLGDRDLNVVQLGAVNINKRVFVAGQAGAVNFNAGEATTLFQFGAINVNRLAAYSLIQWGGVNATAGEMVSWLQLGAINVDGGIKGLQVAAININQNTAKGVQLSGINYAANGYGLQVALINYADNASEGNVFQIGAINIIRHGARYLPVMVIANWSGD